MFFFLSFGRKCPSKLFKNWVVSSIDTARILSGLTNELSSCYSNHNKNTTFYHNNEITEIGTGLPYYLGRLIGEPLYFVLVVKSSEKQAVVSKLWEQRGHLPGVAERIDLPADVWSPARAKRVVQLSVVGSWWKKKKKINIIINWGAIFQNSKNQYFTEMLV